MGSTFRAVWVITGPIFADRHAYAHLGDPGEFPVAIPEALFKIVVKESGTPNRPDVLAFIYPQVGPGYSTRPYNHARFLTTVDEIETATGVDFFMSLPNDVEEELEKTEATALWPTVPADFISSVCRRRRRLIIAQPECCRSKSYIASLRLEP